MTILSVSVVIPTHNRGELVIHAIESVARQSYEQVSTVVVVDGSSDGTMTALHNYRNRLPHANRKRLEIVFQENRGVSAARNNGIRKSDGEFIALLDDDDVWHPEKLAKQLYEVRNCSPKEPLLCTTDYIAISSDDGTSKLVDCSACMTLSGQIRKGIFPPPSTWLFSRSAFEAVNGFDETLHAGEDADFVTELRKLRAIFRNVGQGLTSYTEAPAGKIYRDQVGSAVKTLLKHDAWWRSVLTVNEYERIMAWYRKVLPDDLFRATRKQLDFPE